MVKVGMNQIIKIYLINLRLGCGTTWHSVGLVAVGKDDPEMMKLLQYSRNLYEGFEQEEDGGIGGSCRIIVVVNVYL